MCGSAIYSPRILDGFFGLKGMARAEWTPRRMGHNSSSPLPAGKPLCAPARRGRSLVVDEERREIRFLKVWGVSSGAPGGDEPRGDGHASPPSPIIAGKALGQGQGRSLATPPRRLGVVVARSDRALDESRRGAPPTATDASLLLGGGERGGGARAPRG